jgi:predicted ATPase
MLLVGCKVRLLARCFSTVSRLHRAVISGGLSHDEQQLLAAGQLDRCATRLRAFITEKAAFAATHPSPPAASACASHVSVTLQSDDNNAHPAASPPEAPELVKIPPRVPKGVYLHGCVGSGKTMLMDMFHASVTASMSTEHSLSSRRVHFNTFMLEVHRRIHEWKLGLLRTHGRDVHVSLAPERDAISQVAHRLADEAALLCFDEFQVSFVLTASSSCVCRSFVR